MITFLDENDVEYGALATIKATNAVNGERSLTGTIASGDYVLSNIERGWRLRFDDEYYVVTYAKPIDEGRDVQVTFDAVHQFFWDFDKSSVYDQLSDGSHTFAAYLDFIFKNSGYSYTVDSALNVYAFEKQSFGLKKRLTLFNDIITSTGVEFQVNGKVVRILEKVGTDLSTVVRKNFNMNELTIEKNIGDFVTYQKGYGAYFDEENHSKGRLVVEYTSPLASVYGKLEAEPFVDERYTKSSSMLAVLKENVDNSYTISVSLDMEDLTRAGYKYKQPIAGDYIMAINETLDFQEKIRIVSFTSEYDVQGILVKHDVTCNDIGTVKKLTASYNLTKKQASSASATASNAYSIANKALVSADGKNTNYYSNSFPIDNPKGTLKTGDLLFLTVGDTVKQYYWNGADWITNPVVNDVEAFKEQIAEELKEVPDREEFETTISEKLANSKAEIETQIDTAKTQAESNAKAYADEINQTTAEVAEQANTAANGLKSDLAKVKADLTATTTTANAAKTSASEAKQQLTTIANDLSKAKTDLQNAVSEVDTKATNLQSDLTKAKQDLQTQASQLTEQANAQSELTKRVSSVEETANGTKTTVSELSKTVDSNTKNISSVTARTKTVEDDLTSTKTTLSQVQTTANSASQKTATLETGLNGVKADLAATTATADTTKTNLANYQASNDKAVANLQSNLQTANGNISSLKTRVEAVPGQITSAVSAVEGKIPTAVGARNYIRNYGLTATGWASNKAGWKFEIISDSTAKSGQYLKATCTTASASGGGFYKNLFAFDDGRFFGKQMTWSMDIKLSKAKSVKVGPEWGYAYLDINATTEWKRYSKTFTVATTTEYKQWIVSTNDSGWNVGDIVYIRDVQLEDGSIATSPVPAIEDTESDINAVSSELKQTKDGMTLLATKTELNTAKTDLQSGITTATNKANAAQSTAESNAQTISTHTTQISALNAGLSAKVSQSDFNTLSGRVTTAENNITAKANELSSKITSVEGKIPTAVGARNYIRNYGLTATGWASNKAGWKFEIISDSTAKSGQYLKATCTTASASGGGFYKNLFAFDDGRFFGKQMTWSMDIKLSKAKSVKVGPEWGYAYLDINATTDWKRYSKTFTVATTTEYRQWIVYTNDNVWNVGDIVYIRDVQLEDGSIATSPVPAIEDTETSINTVSSELKQTKDGMTLLATKTDLNTLSGRVTTAENNITAKTNELSSKISSVEGRIPTNLDSLNLMTGTRDWSTKTNPWHMGANWTIEKVEYQGLKVHSTKNGYNGSHQNIFVKNGDVVTFSFFAKATKTLSKIKVSSRWEGSSVYQAPYAGVQERDDEITITSEWKRYSKTIHITSDGSLQFRTEYNGGTIPDGNTFYVAGLKLAKSSQDTGYSENPTDAASDINAISSELKQTTDSIKASVSSLDNSTVKNTSLTINTDGIVMKAGKSTTDVANAIGSYFAVNQNAINLFSDKINVKGNMIVDGAITSNKIASKSINTAHLNGKIITADVIATGAITADAIKAGAITTDKMSANSINGDRITAGTLDAAKIKAGSITASQIASGTITSSQIKAGGISAANIATGAITTDKIAAGAINADKIAANAITADMITGGNLKSTNGATIFDLNRGTITFNNNYGYIQRVAGDRIFEVTTFLGNYGVNSGEYLSSDICVRKKDNSRRAGISFRLYNTVENKPTSIADITADQLTLYDSTNTLLLSVSGRNTFMGTSNFQGWGDIPIADLYKCGLIVKDIAVGGHVKSLSNIVEELCKKTGILWL